MKKQLLIVIAAISLALLAAACSPSGIDSNKADGWDLSSAQLDSLMQQIAAEEYPEKEYEEYMPEEAFAEAYLFGIERDGDEATAHVMLETGSYVAIKGNAYENSASLGEAMIKFSCAGSDPDLNKVIWSADGEAHEKWIKDNFSKESLAAWKSSRESCQESLSKAMNKKVEKEMGVPVEHEYTLSIDDEKGTYEIFEAIESGEGDDYTFDTKTIYSGKLSDLAKDKQ